MNSDRLPEIAALIGRIDDAISPVDGIGKDAIRGLMPDLRTAINDVNAALREIDALLFEGLRDEAIELQEDDFAALAARLNLEDRAVWPEIKQFFAAEGISPPPPIDFETLSSLESAYSELESLRQPLQKLRRIALERATVAERLAVLRELKKADPMKPIWTRTIKEHEEARLVELHPETRRVLAMRDPETIKATHAELIDPQWSVPIPRELIKATRGAEHWLAMRSATKQARDAAKGLEAAWQELEQGEPTPELLERLRLLRYRYHEAARLAAAATASLEACPTVAELAQEEKLAEQVAALESRVAAPLQWLSAQDEAQAVQAQFTGICDQLEQLCQLRPRRAAEAVWLADVERLNAETERLCEAHSVLVYPSLLRERLAEATAAVQSRAKMRHLLMIGAMVTGLAIAVLLGSGLVSWFTSGRQELEEDEVDAIVLELEWPTGAEQTSTETALSGRTTRRVTDEKYG